jgi:hypothetical protein
MAISKTKREQKEQIGLYVGWGEFDVKMLNPSREELNEWLGTEKEDEIEYESEDDDGNKKIRLTFWLENVKDKIKQSVSFWVTDKVRVSKQNEDVIQWVNQSGVTTWGETEDVLPDWFKNFTTKKKIAGPQFFRKAYDGEEQLVVFLSSWLDGVNRREDTGILPDMKKIFKGNIKELSSLIGNEDLTGTVIVSMGVKTKEVKVKNSEGEETDETDVKDFQSIFNKSFLPGKLAKNLRIGGGDDYTRKRINKFKDAHKGEHGFKDFYVFQESKPYDPSMNIIHGENEDTITDDGNDY